MCVVLFSGKHELVSSGQLFGPDDVTGDDDDHGPVDGDLQLRHAIMPDLGGSADGLAVGQLPRIEPFRIFAARTNDIQSE